MRPKVHPSQQKPSSRKAFHYAAYAFWPLLVMWVLYSYPSGASQAAATRHPKDLHALGGGGTASAGGAAAAAAGGGSGSLQQLDAQKATGSAAEWDAEGSSTDAAGAGEGSEGPQRMEHVATVGGGKAGGGGGTDSSGRVYSSCTIFAVRNGSGALAKYYYRFANVRLTRKTLYFFMPPGMKKPQDLWVDFVSGNSTQPKLPTMIVIKGEVQREKWFYLPVKYTLAPSNCAAWTNKPTYFLQVRYSYNIWHTWNEGLMGAFQTLRDQGLLPLVQVDDSGNMREVTEGLSPQCPLMYDPDSNTTRPEDTCVQRLGVVKGTHCDPKNQAWCRPGVVSYRRFDGPIILPYTAASVMNRWAQVYDAMTTDIRDFSLVDGHCFKALFVGKSNTLNYYQSMNQTNPENPFIPERVESMAVFKHFVSTAQREFVAGERAKNPAAVEFGGYVNEKLERLRRGIGPEDIGLVDNIAPSEVPGLLREELPQLKEMWAKRRQEIAKIEAAWQSGNDVVDLAAAGGDAAAAAAAGGSGGDAAGEEQEAEDAADGGGKGGGKAKKRGLATLGEGASRRKLRQPKSGSSGGSLAAPSGEGSRRRLPKRGRGLLQPELDDGLDGGADGGVAAAGGMAVAVEEEAAEVERQADEREAALTDMPSIVKRGEAYQLERPRPVVAYMSRNFFSRGVLNEHDILRYILANYNVTLRVTTFEEPLLEAMELLQHSDVVIGMHGAGWTNGMFVKHGAVAMQMFPYGWRLPDNSTIRGYNYREIVLASECRYIEWINQRWDYAFFRRIDFNRRVKMEYVLHPDPQGPHPVDGWPGNPWIYQNTYVDMAHFGPYIDAAMTAAGIPRVAEPIPVTLN